MATTTLQLTFLMLFTNSCLAAWRRVTVLEGSTMTLSCPLVNAMNIPAEWHNPRDDIMFFNRTPGIADKRYSIEKLSSTNFKISVSDVTFKDGGDYKCIQYGHAVTEKTFAVTVLGQPKATVLKHNRTRSVKCTAEGNHDPPKISWEFGDGIEIAAPSLQTTHENSISKYSSESMLNILPLKKRETICCIVRHLHLRTEPLKNCVVIRASKKIPQTTWTRLPTDEPQGSTDSLRGTTTNLRAASPEATTLEATASNTVSSTGIHLDSMTTKSSQTTRSLADQSQGPSDLWRGTTNETQPTETGVYSTEVPTLSSTPPETMVSTGLYPNTSVAHVPVTELTDKDITQDTSYNSTEGNSTQSNSENMEKQHQPNASFLIFMVTCLIVALSAVVLFLAIKLRRAHIHWKKETEDSDPSIESNKSRSSDGKRPGQKCSEIFNIAFTKYVIEEPTGISNVTTPPPTEYIQPETSQFHVSPHEDAPPAPVRETEL